MKGLLKDSIWYSASLVFSKGINFFLLPVFTIYLTTADYGIIDMFMVFSTLMLIFVGFEVVQGYGRYISEEKSKEKKKLMTSSFLGFAVLSYVLFGIIAIVMKRPIETFLFDGLITDEIYWIAIISIMATGLVTNYKSVFRFTFRSNYYALLGFLQAAVTFPSALILIMYFDLKLEGYFLGLTFGNIICLCVSIYLDKETFSLKIDKEILANFLSYSFPLIFSTASVVLANYIDRIFIKNMLSFDDLGVYGFAFRLASLIMILKAGFISAITPLIFRDHMEKDTPKKIALIFKLYAIIGVTICISYIAFSQEFTSLMSGSDTFTAGYILLPIMTLIMLSSGLTVFVPGLNISKKTGLVSIVQIGYLIMNTLLNYIMIPLYGIMGAAIATAISTCCGFVFMYQLSQKSYRIPHDWKRITILYASAALMVGLFMENNGLPYGFDIINVQNIIIKILIVFLLFILIVSSFLTKGEKGRVLLQIRNMKQGITT